MKSVIYCPICGQNIRHYMKCSTCGYEESIDYEIYPTISCIQGDVESIRKKREEYDYKKFEEYCHIFLSSQKNIVNKLYPEISVNTQIGDIVSFGSYKQSKSLINKKAGIEWIVLDKKDNRLLLLSKFILDCQPYNNYTYDEYENVTWEMCSIRSWLNYDFIYEAFSEEEIEKIAETTVRAYKNTHYDTEPGNDTKDKVFLLSNKEVEEYLKTDEERCGIPTNYANAKGAHTGEDLLSYGEQVAPDEMENSVWWLRTPGDNFSHYCCATVVWIDGSLIYKGDIVESWGHGVRPALWIKLDP